MHKLRSVSSGCFPLKNKAREVLELFECLVATLQLYVTCTCLPINESIDQCKRSPLNQVVVNAWIQLPITRLNLHDQLKALFLAYMKRNNAKLKLLAKMLLSSKFICHLK